MQKINLINQRFGKLKVVASLESRMRGDRKRAFWLCECECGGKAEIESSQLTSGRTQSCGCLKKASIGSVNYKHGEANQTKENRTWFKMKGRCYNPKDAKFPQYGGRGIAICQRWLDSYEDFLADMGRAPSAAHSIDRIDVNGNYEPSNCRWATDAEQANNKTTNVMMVLGTETMSMSQWAKKLGYNYKSFFYHIRYKGKTLAELAEAKNYKIQDG
jgi:hypothetical protein